MGEAMGPNTVAALHLGADHMIEQLEAREAPNERNTAILSTSSPITAGGEVGLAAVGAETVNDDDEAAVLKALRDARRAELKRERAAARFGVGVKLIGEADWQREVVDMSCSGGGTWVVVHLQHDPNPRCAIAAEALEVLACKQPTISFVSIKAEHCMPASQYHLLPSIFCYKDGKLSERLISQELVAPGARPTTEEIEWKLGQLGVLKTELDEEPLPSWSVADAPTSSSLSRQTDRRRQDESSYYDGNGSGNSEMDELGVD